MALTYFKLEPRALAATTVFAFETVTRLAPAAQLTKRITESECHWALATLAPVLSYKTVANVKTANPKIKQ